MSSPTSCLDFLPIPNMSRPLSPFPHVSASFGFSLGKLSAPRMRLAHFAFHPAVQDRLTQFPTITKFECGNFAVRDVTVQGIRGDPQILRRLSHIHHFTRFIHDERHPGARTHANPLLPRAPLLRCGYFEVRPVQAL